MGCSSQPVKPNLLNKVQNKALMNIKQEKQRQFGNQGKAGEKEKSANQQKLTVLDIETFEIVSDHDLTLTPTSLVELEGDTSSRCFTQFEPVNVLLSSEEVYNDELTQYSPAASSSMVSK